METKWYHAVKWRKCYSPVFQSENWGVESSEVDEDGEEIMVVPCSSDLTKRHADLIAAAPETATQRDSLLSVQKQLVEAAELLFVDDLLDEPQGENPMWCEEVHLRLSALRAAILAAKAAG